MPGEYTGSDGRVFVIECPSGEPEIGAWHDLDGYRFRGTLHGPLVRATCIDCGRGPIAVGQPTGRIGAGGLVEDEPDIPARCGSCARAHHGATDVVIRPDYPKVVIDPARLDPEHGGTVTCAEFFAPALAAGVLAASTGTPERSPEGCRACGLPIDPAARTVEHPDVHPTCATYPEDAPMDTPLADDRPVLSVPTPGHPSRRASECLASLTEDPPQRFVLDLYAGAGGWDVGAAMLGLPTVGIEIEHDPCLTAVRAGHPRIRADVATYPTAPFRGRLMGLKGSPPCGGWSPAGTRRGEEDRARVHALVDAYAAGLDRPWSDGWADERSHHAAQPVRWVRDLRPPWVCLEQVPSVLDIWKHIAHVLRGWGYSTWAGVLNAADYGVPQTRQRAILIAKQGTPVHPPEPTHAKDPAENLFGETLMKWVSMAQALGGLTGMRLTTPQNSLQNKSGDTRRYSRETTRPAPTVIGNARNWRIGEDNGPAPTVTAGGTGAGARWSLYAADRTGSASTLPRDLDQPAMSMAFGHASMAWVRERPATTVQGDPRIGRPGHKDRDQGESQFDRDSVRVTLIEAAVLQSFPPDYPWTGSKTSRYLQVGNAVPPRLAAHVLAAAQGIERPEIHPIERIHSGPEGNLRQDPEPDGAMAGEDAVRVTDGVSGDVQDAVGDLPPAGPRSAPLAGECGGRPMSGDYATFLAKKSQWDSASGFEPNWLPDFLFGFQRDLVDWAVRMGRAALFTDCGTGKTIMQLVWAENVRRHTGKPVLVVAPLGVTAQTVAEAAKFGIEAAVSRDGAVSAGITVTNYERLERFATDDFGEVVCDESSAIKAFDGKRKAIVTEFLRTHRYRLLGTATAAPNDYTELGTSSEALGYLGYMDMLGKFFTNKQKTADTKGRWRGHAAPRQWTAQQWRFKGHAEDPFWRWVSSWARAMRRPSDLGYDDNGFVLPPLEYRQHVVTPTAVREDTLFDVPAVGLREEREELRRTLTERCEEAAKVLVDADHAVAWCHLNEESRVLTKLIDGAVEITGSMPVDQKEERLAAFSAGEIRVLVSKPSITGWGLNWQHAHRMTFFPSHSYEQFYQAVRRMWRFGQEHPVTVDVITTPGGINALTNLQRKADAADVMFDRLVTFMRDATTVCRTETYDKKIEVPSWL